MDSNLVVEPPIYCSSSPTLDRVHLTTEVKHIKCIKHATKIVRGSNFRSADHFDGSRQLATVHPVTTPDVVWLNVILRRLGPIPCNGP